MAAPVRAPVVPAPSISAIKSDSEPEAKRKVRAAEPDSRIVVPIRPRRDCVSVDRPRVVGRDVDHLRIRRLNDDGGALGLHGLLVGGFQIAGGLRFLAHDLNGVHYVLLLVVIRITQRRGPGKVLVHISQHGRKRRQSLDAGVPILLIDGLRQRVALQARIVLQEAIGFHDLRWKRRGRQNLGNQRIRVQRNGRNQLLQLVGRLRGVRRRLRRRCGLRILGVLMCRHVRWQGHGNQAHGQGENKRFLAQPRL